MYTVDQYQRDLELSQSLESIIRKKTDKDWIITETHYSYNYQSIKFDSKEILNDSLSGPFPIKKPKSATKIAGKNFPLLRRSEFDLRKFKTNLKVEKQLDEDDDYLISFVSLWAQLENEYKIRFYDPFIPGYLDLLLNVLDKADQLKNNCLESVVRNRKRVTFGLISEVVMAIEMGLKMDALEINQILESIFDGSRYENFFSKYSISKCLVELNNVIRNAGLHENRFISQQLYSSACNKLFRTSSINEWCDSDLPCLFTDYLRLLPETMNEIRISSLKNMIAKVKGNDSQENGNAQIEKLEKDLETLQNNICQI
jgi:hypothetical protein